MAIGYATCMDLTIKQESAVISSIPLETTSNTSLRYLEAIGSYVAVDYGVILDTNINRVQSISVYSFDERLVRTGYLEFPGTLGLIGMNN